MRIAFFALVLCSAISTAVGGEVSSNFDSIRVARIETAAQFEQYLHQASRTPLDALSTEAKQRFIASLRFSSKGLSTYRFDDIEHELTRREAYALTSLFGVEESVSRLHFDKP
jgi:hypothetical protein